MNNFELLRTDSSKLTKRQALRKKKLIRFIIGIILVTIEIIAAALFTAAIFKANIIPSKYLVLGILLLVIVTLYNLLSQFTRAQLIGKTLAVFLALVCFAGNYYVSGYNKMLEDITNDSDIQTHVMSVIALRDNDAIKEISDTEAATFGYIKAKDAELINDLFDNLNKQFSTRINTKSYTEQSMLIEDLYSGKCDVIVMNDATRSMYISGGSDSAKEFEAKTKVIYNYEINKEIVINKPEEKPTNSTEPKDNNFVVYLSGNDEAGKLSSIGNSDVNIVAMVNPTNRQILLITTPRDSYTNLKGTNENGVETIGPDKLTHAGIFGIDGSIWALENLYKGLDIDYYAKINFTGVVTLVNALGGVTVNSEVDFTTSRDTSPSPYHFTVGANYCEGTKALAFCRERHNFALGDVQRGRNQMLMIQAIVNKAMSPTLLVRYSEIMNSISDFFKTNMPQSLISELVKSMLEDSTPWDIQMFNLAVTFPDHYYPSTFWKSTFPSGMSVVIINEDSVEQAKHLIEQMNNGERINVDEYVKANPAQKQ